MMFEKCIKYADEAIIFAQNVNNPRLIIDSLHNKAFAYLHIDKYQKVLEIYSEASKLAEETNDNVMLAIIICYIARTYNKMGYKEIALSEYCRAERYAQEGKDYNFFCRVVLQRIALMFELEKEYNDYGKIARKDLINIAHQKI